MRISAVQVQNFRSIVDSGLIRVEPLQAFAGENNAGKSNLISAIQLFLTAGTGGVEENDFFDKNKPLIITVTFNALTKSERGKLRLYLVDGKLTIEKRITLDIDKRSGKIKPSVEYHGYQAKPKDWWLSTDAITEKYGAKPKWKEIAEENGILDYVADSEGKVNKASYEKGVLKLIVERDDLEFEEPKIGETQALGFQQVLLDELPVFRLLPAVTDYSSEIDRRTTKTTFHLLMGDLADRILKFDKRYTQIEQNLQDLKTLLNAPETDETREEGKERLTVLDDVETKLRDIIAQLMPSVKGVRVKVDIEQVRDLFSRGVSILVDDGKLTEVGMKGHGLQRCVVFGLLQALIMNQRGQLIQAPDNASDGASHEQTIILAIEEPELYIHPQMQRLIYRVLNEFSKTDQVIYSTHSPAFVDVAKYDSIAVVRKESLAEGTKVKQCEHGILEDETERKTFQFLSSFGLEQNRMFFTKKVILVEGEQDEIAILTAGRQLNLFKEFPEELGVSIVIVGNKEEMPKYMKLLNAFEVPYTVLHELDGKPENDINKKIVSLLGKNRVVSMETRLEDVVKHSGHFGKTYDAKRFFEKPESVTENLQGIVQALFA